MFAVSLVVSRSRANNLEQPRYRSDEEEQMTNKAEKEEQQRPPIASVQMRETEDNDDDQKQKTSTFTSMIWNRGRYDAQQKGSPLGQVVESLRWDLLMGFSSGSCRLELQAGIVGGNCR